MAVLVADTMAAVQSAGQMVACLEEESVGLTAVVEAATAVPLVRAAAARGQQVEEKEGQAAGQEVLVKLAVLAVLAEEAADEVLVV